MEHIDQVIEPLVAHNLRMFRGNTPLFATGEGDVLLQVDAECHGFIFLSPEEEVMVLEMRAKSAISLAAGT